MGGSIKLVRVFGIDVKVHWTFFLLLIFFAYVGYAASDAVVGAVAMAALIGALFFCVLLHEFGHSLVAQRLGIQVPDITLLPIGGVARLASLPDKPVDEVKIALAGPAVNVVLAPVFYSAAFLLGSEASGLPSILAAQGSLGGALAYLGFLNIFLALFNMLPAFPMDGGRVLRGLLAVRLGAVRATDVAAGVGRAFALVFFLVGLLGGQIFLILIAVFVFFGAGGEAEQVRRRELARDLTVADVMSTRERTATFSPSNAFGEVLDAAVHGHQQDFPVLEEVEEGSGRVVGMVTRDEILATARSRNGAAADENPNGRPSVRNIMKTDFPIVAPDADLFSEGYRTLQNGGLRAVPVLEDGRLAGMLTVEDVGQASLVRGLPK